MIWAKVTTTFEGVHCWPDIPEDHPKQFLKHPHRHLFHVSVLIEQGHDNRDIEYLVLKDYVNSLCRTGDLAHRSCEMMAQEIIDYLREEWPGRCIKCEVTEDGENGALVEYVS